MPNISILINILIMIWLLSLFKIDKLSRNTDENSKTTYTNSAGYKWCFLIIHFIAYLFIINFGFYKIDSYSNTSNKDIDTLIKLIQKFKKDYLDNFLTRLLFIFNISTFNYIYTSAFILEIIIFTVILYCIRKHQTLSSTVSPGSGFLNLSIIVIITTLFKSITDIWLKIVLIGIVLYYIFQTCITVYNIALESRCDIPDNCYLFKSLITLCNVAIGGFSFVYFLKTDKNNFCKKIIGLKILD